MTVVERYYFYNLGENSEEEGQWIGLMEKLLSLRNRIMNKNNNGFSNYKEY